jgi:hypothetical protein
LVDFIEQFSLGSMILFKFSRPTVIRYTVPTKPVVFWTEWYNVLAALAHAHACPDMMYLGRSAAEDTAQLGHVMQV